MVFAIGDQGSKKGNKNISLAVSIKPILYPCFYGKEVGDIIMHLMVLICPPIFLPGLKMTSPRFAKVKCPLASRFLLILPVGRQKVKGISPSALEVGVRSGEQEPAGSPNRTAIAACFGHDADTGL